MGGKVKATKAEKMLLGMTAAFLSLLLALLLRGGPGGGPGDYTVETQRGAAASAPAPDSAPVDLNTASAEDLADLPGIGPKLARRIVDYREEHGPFASVDELVNVSGIGEAKVEDLRDYAAVS